MTMTIRKYRGFKTIQQAQNFMEAHNGVLCFKPTKNEPEGLRVQEYRAMCADGGLNSDLYPYAVSWNEIIDL